MILPLFLQHTPLEVWLSALLPGRFFLLYIHICLSMHIKRNEA